MKTIDLSIIVISFNTKTITQNCLQSLLNSLSSTSLTYEIIVVDNNSQDNSIAMLQSLKQQYPDKIILLLNNKNLGFSRANNQGGEKAQGTYLLFLNSDTVILDRAVENMYRFYIRNKNKIHFLGAKLLNSDMTPQQSAAHFFSLPVVFAALFLKGDYWGLTRFSPRAFQRVDWISGACIMTQKSIFHQLGGFDEGLFMYMEEVDLLYRAKKQGYLTYVYPDAKIIHLGSASSAGKTFPILQVYRGLLYFYKKHHSPSAVALLKILLQLKAVFAVLAGKISKNTYLIKTYEEAYRIAQMA